MYVELLLDNLDIVLSQYDKTLVMYGTDWCGSCDSLKPKFKKLSKENEGIAFVYVDADKFKFSKTLAKVESFPTIAAFKFDKIIGQDKGGDIDDVKSLLAKL